MTKDSKIEKRTLIKWVIGVGVAIVATFSS
jgi:hypothetical protein